MTEAVGPTWIEVDLDAILHNAALVRSAVAPARLLAVVKADAYGHGAVEVARALAGAGVDAYGVSTVPEARELRAGGVDGPVLVMTPLQPCEAPAAVNAAATVAIASWEAAAALDAAAAAGGARVPVHLKVDTGMGRYGVLPAQLPELARRVAALSRVEVEGVFTHLASAFARDLAPARAQLATFEAAVREAEAAMGAPFAVRHAGASAAVLTLPESHLDLVRVGNLLYGVRPCAHGLALDLRPAWRLRSTVAQVKALPAGWRVGYGGDFVVRRPTVVATLPVGFADGLGMEPAGRLRRLGPLLRALGRSVAETLGLGRMLGLGAAAGSVLLAGRQARVLGRLSMQQTTVDVTGIEGVGAGTVATVLCRSSAASARLPRVFVADGAPREARTLLGTVRLDGLRLDTPADLDSGLDSHDSGLDSHQAIPDPPRRAGRGERAG